MIFFGDFGLRDTFRKRIAQKSIKVNMETLHINFDSPSLDFLVSWKPAHEGIKERYSSKSRYFTVVCHSPS